MRMVEKRYKIKIPDVEAAQKFRENLTESEYERYHELDDKLPDVTEEEAEELLKLLAKAQAIEEI